MKISSKLVLVISTGVILTASVARADTLLGFSFTANDQSGGGAQTDGSQATAPSDLNAAGISSSTITRGSGATGQMVNTTQPSAFNTGAFGFVSTLAAAESGNDYYQFQLSNTQTASLSTVDYSVYSQNNGTNPQNFSGELFYSLDDFATAGVDLGGFTGVISNGGGGSSSYTGNPETADLTGQAALQDLAAGSTVTFRFFGYDGAGYTDQGFGDGGAQDLSILGSVESVPEPSTWAMLFGGLVLAGFGLRRRALR
jgi:hypothetical protein